MKNFLSLLVVMCSSLGFAQEDSTQVASWKEAFHLNGYVKEMQTFTIAQGQLFSDHLLHNRINFKAQAKKITVAVECRNRVIWGETIKKHPGYGKQFDVDRGLVDMTFNVVENSDFVLNSTIDRAWLAWETEGWALRMGRQRINWGINLAWNPNDLFNAYNFVDFDYQERPGSDAIRLQHFTKSMAQYELAYRPDKNRDKSIIAGLYKFNKKGFDIQFIAAHYLTDYVLGTGWTGFIKDLGFKGEVSYFHPRKQFRDTTGVLVSSVSLDYTFEKGVYINLAGLYNSGGTGSGNLSQLQTTFVNLSAKNLMPTQYTAFLQVAGNFTPIFSGGLSTMYLPSVDGLFFIPTLGYSIKENWDLDFVGQLLFAPYQSKFSNISNAVFVRIRWSF